MKCPKCGYKRQLRDDAYVAGNVCPSCGSVYAKNNPEPAAPAHKSPVHESSLQQARERVERKLRRQLESRMKDERHQQTLARAKQIAAAEVRKRMAEWERSHRPASDPAHDTPDESENEAHTQITSPLQKSRESLPEIPPDLPADNTTLSRISAEDTLSEKVVAGSTTARFTANDTWPAAGANDHQQSKTAAHPPKASAKASESKPKSVKPSAQGRSKPAVHRSSMTDIKKPAVPSQTFGSRFQGALNNALMHALPMVAWLILAAGIIGAILSWTTISDVEASMGTVPLPVKHQGLPLGLLLGFAYLATGVLGFGFFRVTSMISRQLKEIRALLLGLENSPSSNR